MLSRRRRYVLHARSGGIGYWARSAAHQPSAATPVAAAVARRNHEEKVLLLRSTFHNLRFSSSHAELDFCPISRQFIRRFCPA